MNKKEAVGYYGSAHALARALGVTDGAVSQWETIPILRQFQLEVLTQGKLMAERPEITKQSA